MERWSRYVVWLVIAVCCFPFVNFVVHGTNLTAHYSENIGNRYFLTMRALETPEFVNPGQGPLIATVHKLLYVITEVIFADPHGQLVARMNLFAYLTLFIGIAFLVYALISVVRDDALAEDSKLLILAIPLMLNFTSFINYSYFMYPDYLLWAQPLMIAAVHTFVKLPLESNQFKLTSFSSYVVPGVLTGLSLALKPTYVFFPAILFAAHIFNVSTKPIVHFAYFFLIVVSIFFGVLLVFFVPTWQHVLEYFSVLQQFAESNRFGRNQEFEDSLLRPFASWRHNTLSIFWWQLAIVLFILVAAVVGSYRRERVVQMPVRMTILLGLLLIELYAYFMLQRGGGSSFNDAVLVIWPVAVIVFHHMPSGSVRNWTFRTAALVGFSLPLAFIAAHADAFITNDGLIPNEAASEKIAGHARWNQQAYDWNRSHGLPVVVLTKHHALLAGTVEDMVMRGMVDGFIGNWDDAEKAEAAKRYFPHLRFVDFESRYAPLVPASERTYRFPKDYVYMWSQRIPDAVPPFVRKKLDLSPKQELLQYSDEFERLISRFVAEEGYAGLLKTGNCRSWDNVHWSRRVYSCVVHQR